MRKICVVLAVKCQLVGSWDFSIAFGMSEKSLKACENMFLQLFFSVLLCSPSVCRHACACAYIYGILPFTKSFNLSSKARFLYDYQVVWI